MEMIERRYTKVTVEMRAQDSPGAIGGYAAVFNRLSRNLGGFVEKVTPTAFNDSRGRDWPDVVARFNHDDNLLLGTSASGSLRLSIDDTGLDYRVEPPKSRSDILELVERGDVRHSSFAFRTIEDEWGTSDQGYPMRTLLNVQLVDVAPVVSPAYPDATAGLRSLADKFHADMEEVRGLAQADELRKFFVKTGPKGEPVRRKVTARAALMDLRAKEKPPWA